jgi:hypothetical protein
LPAKRTAKVVTGNIKPNKTPGLGKNIPFPPIYSPVIAEITAILFLFCFFNIPTNKIKII